MLLNQAKTGVKNKISFPEQTAGEYTLDHMLTGSAAGSGEVSLKAPRELNKNNNIDCTVVQPKSYDLSSPSASLIPTAAGDSQVP